MCNNCIHKPVCDTYTATGGHVRECEYFEEDRLGRIREMKIPESVRIGGIEYKVMYGANVRLGNELCYGKISYDDCTITLSETDGTGHQRRCVTLLHEILHGIRNHAGLQIENEEEIVDMFARGLYQVLQDNGARLFDLADMREETT